MHFYIQHFSNFVYHKEDGLYVLDNDLYVIVTDEKWADFKGYKVYHGRIIVYSEKPKSSGY